ncbi:hypothetical protein CTAYLR_005742 [Chrysophaeum taylorii]|uniref:Uncharacterized protein n=1 Tax=Chrysophaeum taylorii TaxID=2483200 RepID=A0AAD7UK58_9STRA|nr:hypothetical protein CTAYLR_005742 [Chrysophaeum taylorii]
MRGKTVPSSRLREGDAVFRFEAGPSLYSGLSPDASPNPLKHVFQMIGEEPEWITYDVWGAHLPEAPDGYELSIGAENLKEILRRYGGPTAVDDWERLSSKLRPLSKGVQGLPSVAVRNDAWIIATLCLKYPLAFLDVVRNARAILGPFDMVSRDSPFYVEDKFLRNYLDLIAFLLQGLPANSTLTAVMAYMVEDFYREGAAMDFPKGGSKGIVDALARGVEKWPGCSVRKSTAVNRVLVEGGRAVGVETARGTRLRARRAVVSNADLRATYDLVPRGVHEGFDEDRSLLDEITLCKSFMHVHLAFPADAVPADLPPQWTVCESWNDGEIDAPGVDGGVVVVSMPTKLDPDLAPPGYHVIHAYTAGNEPYDLWAPFENAEPNDPDYLALKELRAKPIFDAIEKRAPGLRQKAVVEQIASPLTHARFLRRHRGNYGPAIAAGNPAGLEFPPVTTPLPGYYRAGDSTTAGIGVPAVASSGAQCANAIISVFDQLRLNKAIRMN